MGGLAMWTNLLYMLILLKGSVSLVDTYLEVFGLFLPKTEEISLEKYY